MKLGLISNKYNIFLRTYLEYLKILPKEDIVIIYENSFFSQKNKKLEKLRLSKRFKKSLVNKNFPKIKDYRYRVFQSINDDSCIKFIKKEKISFFLNTGVMQIFKKKFFFNKTVNVHPGYLPYFRGANCPEWAFYYKKPQAITAHFINKDIDCGPIIKRKIIKIKSNGYKNFRSKIYHDSIILGCKTLIDFYKKGGVKSNKLILQKKSEGKFFKPMPQNIFKLLKFKKNEKKI